KQYSERVTELGIWEKPKLDWIRRKGTGWLPEAFELQVGKQSIRIDEDGLKELALAFEEASARGEEWVQYNGVTLATEDLSGAFERLEQGNILGLSAEQETTTESTDTEDKPQPDRAVLKKKENLEEVEFTIDLRPRPLF